MKGERRGREKRNMRGGEWRREGERRGREKGRGRGGEGRRGRR